MIITVRNMSREIYNLGDALCHSKLLKKQICTISGMGMMKPVLCALKTTHTMKLVVGWGISAILDDTTSTTEQDEDDGKR